jgi:hypothetical protein
MEVAGARAGSPSGEAVRVKAAEVARRLEKGLGTRTFGSAARAPGKAAGRSERLSGL